MRMTLMAIAIATGAALAGTGDATAQDELRGTFLGVKDAEGARIRISPDSEGFSGTFFDVVGRRQSFEADRVGGAAEAVLDMDGKTVLMRVDPKPYGANVSLIPIDEQGQLQVGSSRLLTFLREGLSLPEVPPDYVAPPTEPGRRVASNSFLASYAFWPPEGVLRAYEDLSSRFTTLMALFPAIQLDVIFKLCQAPNADRALARALRGQGVSCNEVVEGMAEAQRSGRFARFKGEVASEVSTLRTAVRCADGYVATKQECDGASAAVSKQAISLQTSATVLQRYR